MQIWSPTPIKHLFCFHRRLNFLPGMRSRSTEYGARSTGVLVFCRSTDGVRSTDIFGTPYSQLANLQFAENPSGWMLLFFLPHGHLKLLPKLLCFKLSMNSYSFQPGWLAWCHPEFIWLVISFFITDFLLLFFNMKLFENVTKNRPPLKR